MSFILDALKKAESERNRHVAPVLMDARIAPPRRGLPAWAWLLGAVMLVNVALLGWLLLRTPASPPVVAAATVQEAGSAAQAGVANMPVTPAPVAPLPSALPPPTSTAAPVPQTTAPPPTLLPQPALPSAASPSPRLVDPDSRRVEDDFSLPTVPELLAAGVSLPELHLNLHVYDPAPAYRSVLLNGNRLREGEYTPDGVKVERITPQAVVLEAGGRRFRLDAGG